jgi:carboxymethylenebutenolidase
MADERHTISRREFTALTVAAGVSAATGVSAAPGPGAVDSDVSVKTPSGTCDAALVLPQGSGRWPAIILFPDPFGLRPTMGGLVTDKPDSPHLLVPKIKAQFYCENRGLPRHAAWLVRPGHAAASGKSHL